MIQDPTIVVTLEVTTMSVDDLVESKIVILVSTTDTEITNVATREGLMMTDQDTMIDPVTTSVLLDTE